MDYEKNATMNREEAINVVRNIYQTDKEKEALSILIPELAESEDERIRKEIIHYILYKADGVSEEQEHSWVSYLEKQKEQKPIKVLYIPKFREGDMVVSKNNPRLTYQILDVGNINELGNPEYKVEIFTDGKSDEPRNIKYIEVAKMDSWGELVEQKPAEWSEEDEAKLEDVLYWFEIFCYKNQSKPEMRESLNWLKSLPMKYPKKSDNWKPSEEQMEAMLWEINNTSEGSWQRREMEALYNDLKKL